MRQHKHRKTDKSPKATTTPKTVYRVRNWSAYNKALVGRYDIAIGVEEDTCQAWQYDGPRQQGGQFVFSDVAIECRGTLREVYHLPMRAAEGLLRSLFWIRGVNLPVPSYSTWSRWGQSVAIHLPKKVRGALDLVVDSSGLKVYGEGEWKVRQHGASKRRTWRKIHLAIDPESHEIQAAMMSTAGMDDGETAAPLLSQVKNNVESAAGDGAYDECKVYDVLAELAPQAQVNIPPREDAKIWQHGNRAQPPLPRDENLRRIREVGRKQWKEETDYHRRSLAETAMFRIKMLFGDHLSNRRFDTQASQIGFRCRPLNRMTHLGMPESYPMAT
jgi:antitoxin component of MazEF toxin-antitoxin module